MHFTDAIRRVKWLRQIIIHPVEHRQLVAALWGDFCIDGVVKVQTLDKEGHIQEHAPGSAFALSSERALNYYRGISGTEAFFETWDAKEASWKTLITCKGQDSELFHQVLYLDPNILLPVFCYRGL